MNIAFITLLTFRSIDDNNIYSDLLRKFVEHGHNVYTFCASEMKSHKKIMLIEDRENFHLYHVNTGKIQKTNIIRKGINTLLIDGRMKCSIKKILHNKPIDLLLYTTPPITLNKTISNIKKNNHANTYLLLKDIFPQNSVDLGLLSENGLKGLLFRKFKQTERSLYNLSDIIGCMSQANVDYIVNSNPFLQDKIVEVCPNCIDCGRLDLQLNNQSPAIIKNKYSLPNKKLIVYGGNLGKPQDIDFVIKCIDSLKKDERFHFLVIGDGTEYNKINNYSQKANNLTVIKRLKRDEYCALLEASDIALIFLDHRFTIPNFPSRLLDYMKCGLPIVACTDEVTDIGKVITDNNFGYWCKSVDTDGFVACINKANEMDKNQVAECEKEYLIKYFSSDIAYQTIIKHFINGRS